MPIKISAGIGDHPLFLNWQNFAEQHENCVCNQSSYYEKYRIFNSENKLPHPTIN